MKKTDKYTIQIIAIVLSTVIGVICAVWLIIYMLQNTKAMKEIEELKENYIVEEIPIDNPNVTAPPKQEATENPVGEVVEEPEGVLIDGRRYPDFTGLDVPGLKIDFQTMQKEKNPHIYAWITVHGTSVDYPILQHPEDNAYYLNHDLAGNKAAAGSIFTENYNNKDFNDNFTIIYGHNMKNGTMFKTLHYYVDREFFDEHPYIYLYTEKQTRVYQIYAAYEYNDEHLLLNYNMDKREVFEQYLEEIRKLSSSVGCFNWEQGPTGEDKVITLSTCIANKPEKRYLVQAKLIAVEEKLD